ncbi:MAG: helix-turn-helix domain-containing protein [Bacteroidetes bacterium]|nr:helix-turn-helix domain-containing protein [Bacteroidota bacterium]
MPYTNDMQKSMNTSTQPMILSNNEAQKLQEIHVEETLNLAEKEKDYIIRALKKHRSRRRDAASELGISERTLYRKIKEYDIED